VAFLSLMGEVLSPVTALTGIGQQIQAATGALERVTEVLETVPDVDDEPDATPLPPMRHEIRLERVWFSYSPERRTLDGIDAVIPAGSRVAFVGPTGAGKSSVLLFATSCGVRERSPSRTCHRPGRGVAPPAPVSGSPSSTAG